MRNDIKEMAIYFANAILLVVAMIIVAFVILTTMGCSSKEQVCEPVEKIVEVYKPVPMKCDLNISFAPDINTTTLQSMLNSVTELTLDGIKVRKEIIEVPCLNINYIK